MRQVFTRRAPDPAAAFLDEPPTDRWDEVDEPAAGGPPDHEPPGPPRPSGPGITPGRIAAIGAILLAVIGLWFVFSLFQPFKGDGKGVVALSIPRGAGSDDIGKLLADKGVISKSSFFRLRAKLAGKNSDLKPGNYVLRKDMSYGAVLDLLAAGPPPPRRTKITITEGRSRAEASALLKKTSLKGNYFNATRSSPLLNPRSYGAPRSVSSLEGFLFPATYDVRVGAPIKALVDQQLTTFKQRFNGVDLRRAKKKNLTAYDVLIIASMIEREAQLDKERPLIAAVIYNRLKQGIPLGIDATTRYAINDYTRPLRNSDFARSGAYNTRANKGLPPTPIGNPGLASMTAAANPAKVKFLYYVVKPGRCGEHAFSSTDAQFQRDAERYSQARNAAGGNSPTTCKS